MAGVGLSSTDAPKRADWPAVVEVKVPEVKDRRKPESPIAKMFIGGAASLAFEFGGGHALQFLKIQKQTTGLPYGTIIRQITQQKGVYGLLDGFFPWGAMIAIDWNQNRRIYIWKGAVFAFGHAGAKKMLDGHMPSQMAEIMAGGVGGFIQGIVANPLLLFTTRVMTNPAFRERQGFVQSMRASTRVCADIIRHEGPLALMKGAPLLAGKRVVDWTTRFFFVVVVEETLRRGEARQLSFAEKCGASLAGGVLSCAATIPLDVMVATVQQNAKAGQKVPLFRTAIGILRGKGVAGLVSFSTRGLVARATHVALATLLMKTLTSAIYDVVYTQPETSSSTLTQSIPSPAAPVLSRTVPSQGPTAH